MILVFFYGDSTRSSGVLFTQLSFFWRKYGVVSDQVPFSRFHLLSFCWCCVTWRDVILLTVQCLCSLSMPSKYTAKVVLGFGKRILYECIGSLLKYFLEEITRDKSENVPFCHFECDSDSYFLYLFCMKSSESDCC